MSDPSQTAASAAVTAKAAGPAVAVLGLGAMGLPMAGRLAERFAVRGFDPFEAQRLRAGERGVQVHDTARGAAAGADIVLVAVRNEPQLLEVLFGDDGVVDVVAPNAVVIMTSTVGTAAIPATAERLAEKGIAFVDAPLSGGALRAAVGDLLVVVGGSPEARGLAQPVLDALASTVTVVGDNPGDGQALKTVNQLLCGIHVAAAAEALALADALGLDREKTFAALEVGAAGSFMLSNRGPRMLHAYDEVSPDVLSRLDILVKDMGIVGTATRTAGLAAPVAAAAEQLYLLAVAQGYAAADDSSLIRVVAPQLRGGPVTAPAVGSAAVPAETLAAAPGVTPSAVPGVTPSEGAGAAPSEDPGPAATPLA